MRIIKLPHPYCQTENKEGRKDYPSPDQLWQSLEADREHAKKVALNEFGQEFPFGREIGVTYHHWDPRDHEWRDPGLFDDHTGPPPPDKQFERMSAVAQTLHSLRSEDDKAEYQKKVSGELRAELQLRDAPEEWIEYQIYAFWYLVLQLVIFIEDGWRWKYNLIDDDDDIPF